MQPPAWCLTHWHRRTILYLFRCYPPPPHFKDTRICFWRGYSVYVCIVYLHIYSVACPVIVYDFVIDLFVNIVLQLTESICASDTEMSDLYPSYINQLSWYLYRSVYNVFACHALFQLHHCRCNGTNADSYILFVRFSSSECDRKVLIA
jgi:hypothetical protein